MKPFCCFISNLRYNGVMSKLKIFKAKHSIADQTCQECGAKAKLDYDPTTIAGKGNEAGFVYQRPILTCTDPECLEEFVAPEDAKELHDAFCQSAGLLMPEEIKAIREDYGKRAKNGKISQKNFALELGMGNSTIARYELRMQVQSKVHDLVLRACRELEGFDDLVNRPVTKDERGNGTADVFSIEERRKVKESLASKLNPASIARAEKAAASGGIFD